MRLARTFRAVMIPLGLLLTAFSFAGCGESAPDNQTTTVPDDIDALERERQNMMSGGDYEAPSE